MSSKKVSVPADLYWKTEFVQKTQKLWFKLGQLETTVLEEELESIQIQQPIYVTSLARSGTTVLTEMLAAHSNVSCHRYSDFPFTYIPFWANWLREKTRFSKSTPKERIHGDRIMVTNDSPEAVEEVLWMYFHPQLHAGNGGDYFDPLHQHEAFESFYRSHIQKLLLVRNKQRYLAKGNYHITRIPYLLKLFPDAKFVIPIRNPVNHIASLMKQHRFFVKSQKSDDKIRKQLGRAGHFEFGLDLQWIETDQPKRKKQIEALWGSGEEVAAWSEYWASIFQHVLDISKLDSVYDQAIKFVPYERLCSNTGTWIDNIFDHCNLSLDAFLKEKSFYINHLTEPEYYQPGFTEEELEIISAKTGPVAEQFGYSI